MKKVMLIFICCLCCLFLSGCVSKDDYASLEGKYNDLVNSQDISKETEYLDKLFSNYTVQKSKMGKSTVLEIYWEFDNDKSDSIFSLNQITKEEWFEYDYIMLHAYYMDTLLGSTQINGKTGSFITTTSSSSSS